MKLERSLFQKSHIYFSVFFLFMLAGFWLTYFTKILDQENYRMHVHGLVMILWCVLLIVQPYLIKSKKYSLHRQLGKFSYVLVPLIAFTTIDLLKYRLSELTALSTRDYLATASVFMALLTFLVFYGLSIYHKRSPAVHARYMVCTVFATFTAVVDRIIDSYFPFIFPYLPDVDGPVLQVIGLTLGDFLLAILCIWDWRSHRRLNIFPIALAIHLFYHFSVLNFYKYEFWRDFSNWFFAV